ncbi:PepSY domain-containing protein [Lentibacillus sediminis]|uniref:PepSY domain-containing protein n=1 Tax=Lentibacillus sediminis TaxID=1940529 RepID=UPI000C1C2837|nr:PepSY domain-containing protein [Lentibacillus sediminis]
MKKKSMIFAGALTGAVLLVGGVYQTSADQQEGELSADNIRQMVGEQYTGEITELELEKEQNRRVYEVEVEDGDQEVELKMDAATGEVLNERVKDQNGRNENQRDDGGDDRDDDRDDQNNNSVDKSELISSEEAGKIAKGEFSGKITELELDEDDDRYKYEIELVNGNEEAEIEIDARTGEVWEVDVDTEDQDDDDNDDD